MTTLYYNACTSSSERGWEWEREKEILENLQYIHVCISYHFTSFILIRDVYDLSGFPQNEIWWCSGIT